MAHIGNKLTTITLTNQNPNSQYTDATINIASGKCTILNNQEVTPNQLIKDFGFKHHLLMNYKTDTSTDVFHYEYDDMQGLLHAPVYVYSNLLKSANPDGCIFKINPSPIFQHTQTTDDLYFSISPHQCARESITIMQLEAIVSHLSGHPFKFINNLLIDETFTIKNLPLSIKGDLLSLIDKELETLLLTPCDLNRFELRYINPKIGFGLFSRERIKKGEVLFPYYGKKHSEQTMANYKFGAGLDCLNLSIDAREFGNLARFINHAPQAGTNASPLWLDANLLAEYFYLTGQQIILFSATRDIEPGEHLLLDYGALFFKNFPPSRFKSNHKALPWYKKIIAANSNHRLNHLRIMARHGVKYATRYLLLRIIVIIGVIFLLMGFIARL